MIHRLSGKDHSVYTTAFLDFDGTILKSGEGVVNAVRYMFSRLDMSIPDEQEMFKFVGPPIKHHMTSVYGMDALQAEKAYMLFREYYNDKGVYESYLYDGITDVLEALRCSGQKLYIATCKQEPTLRDLLDKYEILDLFDDAFGAWHDQGIYDKTQVLQNGFRRIGGHPDHAVMVGDRYYDIEGGKAVGLDTAGVLYGYGDRNELSDAGADYLLDNVEDIAALLGGRL